jgi:hypothetical protein
MSEADSTINRLVTGVASCIAGQAAETPCPKCGESLGLSFATHAAAGHLLAYTVQPREAGSMMTARSLGEHLKALAAINESVGREMGLKVQSMVSDITMSPEGAIKFTLFLAPLPKKARQTQPLALR